MTRNWQASPSAALLDIVEAFVSAADEGTELYGYSLAVKSRRGGAEVYLESLDPLEQAGWISARWQTAEEGGSPGRRRRFYKLTPDGLTRAREMLATHRPPGSRPSLRHRVLGAVDTVRRLGKVR
jgi:PadR family transcriptional regulator, regulatory protein PadR